MADAEKKSSPLFFFLKIALAAAVVWILFSRGQQEIIKSLRSFDYRYLIPPVILHFVQTFFVSWRWRELAVLQGIRLSLWDAFSVTMQCNFFSLVIPGGAIGGDVVKMAVVSKRAGAGHRMEGIFSVFMDRITGMISLFTLTLILLIPGSALLMKLRFGQLSGDPSLNILFICGTALLCLTGLGGSVVIFSHRLLRRIPGVPFLMEKAEKFSRGAVSRMTGATDLYARYWKRLGLWAFLTTFFVHLLAVLPYIFLFMGLGIKVPVFTAVLAVVIGNIAGLIPLFPGGVGIRDLVTVTILSAGAVAAGDAKTVQLLSTALMLVLYLTGGIFFVFDPGRGKKELKNEQQ